MQIPEIETFTVEEQRVRQLKLLKDTLNYLNQNSAYYKELFKEKQLDPDKISSVDDIRNFPVTTKDEIQNRNFDFYCADRKQIIDYSTTSGTLGDPVIFPLTEKDLQRLTYNEYLSLMCTGGSEDEIYLLTTTMDRRFMAGLAYFNGARKLGAGVVRVGPGIPELQWDTISKINPTAIIAVPSFILALINYAEKNGIDYKKSSIRKAVCIGEPIRNSDYSYNTLGKKITEKWPLQLFSTYASTEMIAAFTECEYGAGGHHHPELLITEFLDDNNMPVKEGEPGELTVTTLGVEGMPLLRFKTGDICYFHTEPCRCGRKTLRISPIIGRKKQMIKYKGTTLYPPALYDILDNIEGIRNYLVEVTTNSIGTDEIIIYIGCDSKSDNFEKEIKDHFRARVRVSPSIIFQSPEEIKKVQFPETSRKPVKFIDRR
jgi:phenylacetate-CoA ligase